MTDSEEHLFPNDFLKNTVLEHCNSKSELLQSTTLRGIIDIIERRALDELREKKSPIFLDLGNKIPIFSDLWERIYIQKGPISRGEQKAFLGFLKDDKNKLLAGKILSKLRIGQSNDNIAFIKEYLIDENDAYSTAKVIEDMVNMVSSYPHIIPIDSFITSRDYGLGWNYILKPTHYPGVGTQWICKTSHGVSIALIREDNTMYLPMGTDVYDSISSFDKGSFIARKRMSKEGLQESVGAIWLYDINTRTYIKAYERANLAHVQNPDKYGFSITDFDNPDSPLPHYESRNTVGQKAIKIEGTTVRELAIPDGVLVGRYTRGSGSRQEGFSQDGLIHLTRVVKWDGMDNDFLEGYTGVGMYDPNIPGNFRILIEPDEKVDGSFTFCGKVIEKTAISHPTQSQGGHRRDDNTPSYYYYKINTDGLESLFPEPLSEQLEHGCNTGRAKDGRVKVIFFSRKTGDLLNLTKPFGIKKGWEMLTRHTNRESSTGMSNFSIQLWDSKGWGTLGAYFAVIDGKYYYIGFPEKGGKYLDGSMSFGGGSSITYSSKKMIEDIQNGTITEEVLPIDIEARLAQKSGPK